MKKTKASAVQNSAVMKLDGMLSELKSDTAKTQVLFARIYASWRIS